MTGIGCNCAPALFAYIEQADVCVAASTPGTCAVASSGASAPPPASPPPVPGPGQSPPGVPGSLASPSPPTSVIPEAAVPPESPSSGGSPSIAAVVGGIVGGVALLAILAAAAVCFIARRRKLAAAGSSTSKPAAVATGGDSVRPPALWHSPSGDHVASRPHAPPYSMHHATPPLHGPPKWPGAPGAATRLDSAPSHVLGAAPAHHLGAYPPGSHASQDSYPAVTLPHSAQNALAVASASGVSDVASDSNAAGAPPHGATASVCFHSR